MATAAHHQPDIVTARLRLRPLRPRDAALIALHAGDRRVAAATALIPHPYPPGAAEAFIERVTAPGATERCWAIDAGEGGGNGLIGTIGLEPAGDGVAAIGYWVAPAFWNVGYASEAVEGLIAFAAGDGWRALTAEVFQDNLASAKVLTRAGFAWEGEGEGHSVARGAMVPTFRYRLDLG
ncbi:GNAT family N-acetyltransferase [Amaricoccus sp.]|uniref:GNAT family N-acetyltransferase n=1 Tax=Amaricoccus sp. TaxID=1872485 RepID=UPI001B6BDF17|nr:GNAT family N-acetyltransferase [Amaricoccus sp.]MBP7241986.1 GNAT family N-acetyltransferase [Amaricoccus sp.]